MHFVAPLSTDCYHAYEPMSKIAPRVVLGSALKKLVGGNDS